MLRSVHLAHRARKILVLACALAVAVSVAAVASASPTATNPFARAHLWVNPASDAARQRDAWQRTRPSAARQMSKLADSPSADWLGGWLPNVGEYVRWSIRTRLAPDHNTAFFAVYDLPHRDCSGSYSAGGAGSAAAYRAWIDQVAGAIGGYPAIVVVEPDGLPDSFCLSPALRAQRSALEAYAVSKLSALGNTSVYLDAGRASWKPAPVMVSLLRLAGIARARGFALNVTGYDRTSTELAYGNRIARALGDAHFIVSTSRNGRGPLPASQVHTFQDAWCNQPGRALGPRPTTNTHDPYADAFEWVLHPGYSDGYCHGGGAAGTWWPAFALTLARNAAW